MTEQSELDFCAYEAPVPPPSFEIASNRGPSLASVPLLIAANSFLKFGPFLKWGASIRDVRSLSHGM